MEAFRKAVRRISLSAIGGPLMIAALAGLEFSWLKLVVGNGLVAGILTIATPLSFASLFSRHGR